MIFQIEFPGIKHRLLRGYFNNEKPMKKKESLLDWRQTAVVKALGKLLNWKMLRLHSTPKYGL